MIKKAGAFSNRYMSNPLPGQHRLLKEKNKENKNPNSTIEQPNHVSNSSLTETKVERTSPLMRQRDKTQSKFKAEYQKQTKELKQLQLQIAKLRKENQRLRQDARRANKTNQQNICSYEAYIKQLEGERDRTEDQSKAYAENLKFCIIWMIEAYALTQDTAQHRYLLTNKLGKQKMSQVFKKLIIPIENLQLKKKLLEIAKNEVPKKQEYLICSKEESKHDEIAQEHSIDELHDMLDTFDLQRNKEPELHEQDDRISRRLFVNEDTFGEEIGQHSISQGYENNEQVQDDVSSPSIQALIGTVVTVKAQVRNQSQDYLRVKKGEQIKLLKKVGDLWIAEKGCQIGYITHEVFQ